MWAALGAFGLWAKLGAIAALIVGAGVLYGVWHHRVYQRGYDAAIAAIAAQDKEAVNAADAIRTRVRDCNADPRRMWDAAAGQCVGR